MTHENKLGMFIHWGIYALTEEHEQVFARRRIPRDEYETLKDKFNPRDYDPESWVLLAKEAGMKYICFTTKHHDGFCMWDTKETDYNIMNTPYGKDVLKMLADACKKHGMLLSLYYSCPDWHHPHGFNPAAGSHQWCAVEEPNFDQKVYLDYVRKQVKELLSNYGPIYTFFWDIPPRIYEPSINELIRELQPGIFINDRGYDKGDFSTPERDYQPGSTTRFTRMTEACNSVGEQSWGYRREEDFYSFRFITSEIDRVMSLGGSFLLNVGPNADGVITPEYSERIRRIGNWYNRMGGALECHEEDNFDYNIRGNNCIVTKKNGKTYLHFANGPHSSAVALGTFPSMPKAVKLLNTGSNLSAKFTYLPEYALNGYSLPHLHITGIPIDELSSEPVVIEIEW